MALQNTNSFTITFSNSALQTHKQTNSQTQWFIASSLSTRQSKGVWIPSARKRNSFTTTSWSWWHRMLHFTNRKQWYKISLQCSASKRNTAVSKLLLNTGKGQPNSGMARNRPDFYLPHSWKPTFAKHQLPLVGLCYQLILGVQLEEECLLPSWKTPLQK